MRTIRDYFKSKNAIIAERNELEGKLLDAQRALRESGLDRSLAQVEAIAERERADGLLTEVESLDAFQKFLSQKIEDFDQYTMAFLDEQFLSQNSTDEADGS